MVKLDNIQTEVDASFLYSVLSKLEENPAVAKIFSQMSEIENSHAVAFLKSNDLDLSKMPKPSFRAKTIVNISKFAGKDFILGILLDTEKRLTKTILKARKDLNLPNSISDTSHVNILNNILEKKADVSASEFSKYEKQHRSIGGNALRAAVLGGNDGLVSNFSLVMGIAGATNGQSEVLLTGLAGLLAGALSMALGEWISVKSSQELYENQMELEMAELEHNPKGEQKELELIYLAKGFSEEEASKMAFEAMQDKDKAHKILVKEELGLNTEELEGSAMEAAVSSFLMFAVGAILPVIPYFWLGGRDAIIFSSILSAIGLFLIGGVITLFTGKSFWRSGLRQVAFGLAAAAITFGIGKLIGVSIAG
ncbi:MAG: VIT1/CCC1 transporter family protein [Cytophagaceae bacterium]|nr:VIT1/CCC1 transporter family protein [Cytophagaceae bacterium]MBL0300388.1 VIT1/CCC1 transporter family protein [Cytophagaceae bacterium]MBL0327317.1 VIT1/CCC1 transporter family protein [Cytophagaceae bacterium]